MVADRREPMFTSHHSDSTWTIDRKRRCRKGLSSSTFRSASRPIVSSCPSATRNHSPQNSTEDRKSTRLNSSHVAISYAVFCLKKKKSINTVNGCDSRQRHRTEQCRSRVLTIDLRQ